MRYAQAYHYGGEWRSEDFHEDSQRRFTSMATRATNGGRVEAVEWTRIAAELRRVGRLHDQCPLREEEAQRSARNADIYARSGVPGGIDPRRREARP
jgi:hypothetical protein